MTIPASQYVSVTPGVLSAGASAVSLTGLLLTTSTRVPIGTVQSFGSPAAVASYFGPSSAEAAQATVYFAGFDNSTTKPGALLISQYPTAAVAGYLRGAPVTLAQVQGVTSGTLTVTANGGSALTSSAVNLSTATSLSNAATMIQSAFTSPGFTVTYDAISGGFLFTSTTTGATSAVSFATGIPAATLNLTQATGAVTSAGSIAYTPAAAMAAIVGVTTNWATFWTLFEPNVSDKVSFATWTNGQGNRYVYALWSTEAAAYSNPDTTSSGAQIIAAGYSGTVLTYAPVNQAGMGAFVAGCGASLDFTRTDGRRNIAYLTQSGLAPDVTSGPLQTQLIANGYNSYGAVATATTGFTFFYPGSVTGQFRWLDSYWGQVELNSSFQAALMTLLTSAGSIPYNTDGDSLIEAACADPISSAVGFGTIRPGVNLSALQQQELNTAAGLPIASVVASRGWYLLSNAAGANPTVRAARGPPPLTFWYTDGGSINSISLFSEMVQ